LLSVPINIEEEGNIVRREYIDEGNAIGNEVKMDINKDRVYMDDVHVAESEVFSNYKDGDASSKDRRDKEKGQDRRNEELKNIQRQIKELVKKKNDIKKDYNKSSNFEAQEEKPLPQRLPKARPRVMANVQLVPPRSTTYSEGKARELNREMAEDSNREGSTGLTGSEDNRSWKRTDARKRKGYKAEPGQSGRGYRGHQTPRKEVYSSKEDLAIRRQNNNRRVVPIRRPAKTAAVMIVGNDKEFSYADALKQARSKISLDDLGIDNSKVRKAANGGLIVEVLGPDGAGKANALAEQLRVVLKDTASH